MVFGYFSLSGGFLKLNAAFPVIFAVAGYAVKSFVTSPISDTVLASLNVPLAKVPALAAVSLVALAFLSVVPTILGLSMYQVYDNSNPRGTKSRENLKNYPTIHRMQNAHDNTLEFLALMAPCLWSASTLGLDELLFAKLMALVFIAVSLAPVQQLSPAPTLVICARARSLSALAARGLPALLLAGLERAAHDRLHHRPLRRPGYRLRAHFSRYDTASAPVRGQPPEGCASTTTLSFWTFAYSAARLRPRFSLG